MLEAFSNLLDLFNKVPHKYVYCRFVNYKSDKTRGMKVLTFRNMFQESKCFSKLIRQWLMDKCKPGFMFIKLLDTYKNIKLKDSTTVYFWRIELNFLHRHAKIFSKLSCKISWYIHNDGNICKYFILHHILIFSQAYLVSF